jgi:hypothetical protein
MNLKIARPERRAFLIGLCIIVVVLGCKKNDMFHGLRAGDYGMVIKGSYRGTAEYIGAGENYSTIVKRYRRAIEKNADLLPKITRYHFRVPDVLAYDFKMVLLDRTRGLLVLRYYAPIRGDRLIAGYQLFFVLDPDRDALVQIYSSEVPLE